MSRKSTASKPVRVGVARQMIAEAIQHGDHGNTGPHDTLTNDDDLKIGRRAESMLIDWIGNGSLRAWTTDPLGRRKVAVPPEALQSHSYRLDMELTGLDVFYEDANVHLAKASELRRAVRRETGKDLPFDGARFRNVFVDDRTLRTLIAAHFANSNTAPKTARPGERLVVPALAAPLKHRRPDDRADDRPATASPVEWVAYVTARDAIAAKLLGERGQWLARDRQSASAVERLDNIVVCAGRLHNQRQTPRTATRYRRLLEIEALWNKACENAEELVRDAVIAKRLKWRDYSKQVDRFGFEQVLEAAPANSIPPLTPNEQMFVADKVARHLPPKPVESCFDWQSGVHVPFALTLLWINRPDIAVVPSMAQHASWRRFLTEAALARGYGSLDLPRSVFAGADPKLGDPKEAWGRLKQHAEAGRVTLSGSLHQRAGHGWKTEHAEAISTSLLSSLDYCEAESASAPDFLAPRGDKSACYIDDVRVPLASLKAAFEKANPQALQAPIIGRLPELGAHDTPTIRAIKVAFEKAFRSKAPDGLLLAKEVYPTIYAAMEPKPKKQPDPKLFRDAGVRRRKRQA